MNIEETNVKNPVHNTEADPRSTLSKQETTTNKVAQTSLIRGSSFSYTASSSDFSDTEPLQGNHNFPALLDADKTVELAKELKQTFLNEIERMHPRRLATIVVEKYPQALSDFFLKDELKNALRRTPDTVELENQLTTRLERIINGKNTLYYAHDRYVVAISIRLSLKGQKLEDSKDDLIRILKELSLWKGDLHEKLKAGVQRHLTKTLETIDLQSLQNFESNLENAKPDQKSYTSLKGTFDLLYLGSISKNKKSISERISDSVSRFLDGNKPPPFLAERDLQ
jgi:hypothetical protein